MLPVNRKSPVHLLSAALVLAALGPLSAHAQDASTGGGADRFKVTFADDAGDRLAQLGHAECVAGVLDEQTKLEVQIFDASNGDVDYYGVVLVQRDGGEGCNDDDAQRCADSFDTTEPERCGCVGRSELGDGTFTLSGRLGRLLFGQSWSSDGTVGCISPAEDSTWEFVPAYVPLDSNKSARFKQGGLDAGTLEDDAATTVDVDITLGASVLSVRIDEREPPAAGALFITTADRALSVSVSDEDVPAEGKLYACARQYDADGSEPSVPGIEANGLFYSTNLGDPTGVEFEDICQRSAKNGDSVRLEGVRPGASYAVFGFIEDQAGNFSQPVTSLNAQSVEYYNFAEYYKTAGGGETGGCQGLPGVASPAAGAAALLLVLATWARRRRGGR